MIYESLTDLPEDLQTALPRHAQEIFREASNHAFEEDGLDHDKATRAGMAAVQQVYYLDDTDNRWKKK